MAHLTATQLARAATDGDSLGNMLIPCIYWAEDQLFIGTDGRLTSMFEVVPANCQDMDDETLTALSNQLARCIAEVPTDGIIQAVILPSRRIEDVIKRYRSVSEQKPNRPIEKVQLLRDAEDAVVELMQAGTQRALLSSGDYEFTTKVFRIVITATVFPSESIGLPFQLSDGLHRLFPFMRPKASYQGLSAAEERFLKQYQDTAAIARDLADRVRRTLTAIRCTAEPLDHIGYQRIARELIYPLTGHKIPVNQDADCLLYQEVPVYPITIDLDQGSITSDGTVMRVASLKAAPALTDPGAITLPNRNLGGATILDYLGDGFISIAAMTKPRNAMRRLMDTNLRRIRNGFVMSGRKDLAEADYARAQEYVEEGRRICATTLNVVVRAKDAEDAETRIKRMVQYVSEAGIPLQVEQGLGPSLWIHSLPGNAFPPIQGAKRDKLLPDRAVADLFPVFFHSRGSSLPHVAYFNRAGEPFLVSPFGGANANGFIGGKSGSGKTVNLAYIILSLLRVQGAQAFIVDKGRSYIQLAEELGDHGQFIDLSGSACCINPFAGTFEDAAQFLENLLVHLATPSGGAMDEDDLALLNKAIQYVYFERRKTVSWTSFEALVASTSGKYISQAYKPLRTAFISERTRKTLEMSQNRNSEAYSWRIWYLLRCTGARQGDDIRPFSSSSSPSEAEADFIISQRCQIQDDPAGGMLILVPRPDMVETMTRHGFVVSLIPDQCEIDVGTMDEVMALEKAGVEFRVPDNILAQAQEAIRREIIGEGGTTTIPETKLAEMVANRVKAFAPRYYFEQASGTARVQDPVEFSMLGARLEHIAQDENTDDGVRAKRLVARLRPYWGTGAKAAFFDGPTSFNLAKCKLAVFELDGLSGAGEHLMSAVLQALMHQIAIYIKDPSNSWRKMFCAVDEGWSLARYPACASAIEESARTIRKFGGAQWLVTQSIGDIERFPAIKTLINLSPNKYLLRQEREDALRATDLLGFTNAQRDLVVGLTGKPGLFSEIMIYAHDLGVVDVAVCILPPILYWITTTNSDDRALLEQKSIEFVRDGHSFEEGRRRARKWCAEHYPHGSFRA